MVHIKQAVIVEGKYDKIKLASLCDALVIETNGFQIFQDKERLGLIRRIAQKRGILILTDSDAAGFQIRSFLGGALPKDQVAHAYIPELFGKEKRKSKPSSEGKLGVEGVPGEAILQALKRAGAQLEESVPSKPITAADLYDDGLSGCEGSSERRARFLHALSLPRRLRGGALLQVLNALMDYEQYKKAVQKLNEL